MGSFTKNFRKRALRTKFEASKKMNLYLMQRVSDLMDQVKKEPTIEERNQQQIDYLMSVTCKPPSA